jgi:outer membrane protein OmpA-like peptidoglycan-associated protein
MIAVLTFAISVIPYHYSFGQEDEARVGLSRPMRTAIQFYENGEDGQAMDRFMEILTRGDPSERTMANEYINLLTQRMNGMGTSQATPAMSMGAVSVENENKSSDVKTRTRAEKPASAKSGEVVTQTTGGPLRLAVNVDALDDPEPTINKPSRSTPLSSKGEQMSSANKALMRKEIQSRLRTAQDKAIVDLRAIPGIRVVLRGNGDPDAIGIPTSILFQSGISFQRDAVRVLEPLTKLVFSVGSTQILILPEGTAIGDAKVLDMRRTMGISATLYQAGVAPPRVRVNLLNTQVKIPRPLADFKGVVIVFQYDQAMSLAVENAVGDELGPPISLGVFPSQIRPGRNQGAIVEFSVSDPPAGLVSWKFQLLQPSKDGSELAPLQEVLGGGPVFHQIFWNGKENYFGRPLAPGRYECVLTALDAKNRQRTLHKWIEVLADHDEGEKILSDAPEIVTADVKAVKKNGIVENSSGPLSAPSDDLQPSDGSELVKGVKPARVRASLQVDAKSSTKQKKKAVQLPHKAKNKIRPNSLKAAKPVESESASSRPGSYTLDFGNNTHQMSTYSEKLLAKAASELEHQPLETLDVVGMALSDESDPASLAERRAKMVAGLLINRYQVDPKKLRVSSNIGDRSIVILTMRRGD